MIVRFDSFGRYQPPIISVCSPSSQVVTQNGVDLQPTFMYGKVNNPQSLEMEFNFNAYSEITFDVDKDDVTPEVFARLQTRMYLYAEGYGYFIITDCEEERDNDEIVTKKSITAKSAEQELLEVEAPYVPDETYQFANGSTGILDMCAEIMPRWTFNFTDMEADLKALNRYFVDAEFNTMYEFLIDCLQTKYDCVFEFDIIHRVISAYSKAYYVSNHETDIHLSNQNVIKTLTRQSSTDDIYTAMKVEGGNDLDIQLVNPLGTRIIYDFTYRKSAMSSALQTAVAKWEAKVASVKATYASTALSYATAMDALALAQSSMNEKKSLYDGQQMVLDNMIADEATTPVQLDAQKAVVAAALAAYNDASDAYNAQKTSCDALFSDLQDISEHCGLNTSATDIGGQQIFTADLLNELSGYIYTGEYQNEDITQTDTMTFSDVFAQAQQLMAEAEEQLTKYSTENFKFTIKTDDFIFNELFSRFTSQLEPGVIVWAESEEDLFEQYHISKVSVDFEEQSSELTFSNKYNKYDIQTLFDDVLGSVSKSASQLSRVVGLIEDQQKRLDEDKTAIDTMMTLTADHVLSSGDQSVTISGTGYWGRKNAGTDPRGNPLFDPEQIKIINNGLYLTDDNWSTVKAAIGKIVVGQSGGQDVYAYGVIADVIIGKMILGQNLTIEAQDDLGTAVTTVNGDGVSVYGGNIKIYAGDPSNPGTPVLSMDNQGNLILNNIDATGTVTATAGSIGGWNIANNALTYGTYDSTHVSQTPFFALNPDGPVAGGSWMIVGGAQNSVNYSAVFAGGPQYGSPFMVGQDGSLWCSDAHILGNITANALTIQDSSQNTIFSATGDGEQNPVVTIGGWQATQDSLFNKDPQDNTNQVVISVPAEWGSGQPSYPGAKNVIVVQNGNTYPFYLWSDGFLHAENADITGAINATSGNFSNCTIGGSCTINGSFGGTGWFVGNVSCTVGLGTTYNVYGFVNGSAGVNGVMGHATDTSSRELVLIGRNYGGYFNGLVIGQTSAAIWIGGQQKASW